MEDDYYSVDSILAENQKIQCTFKVDVPDMGHLDGGNERRSQGPREHITKLVVIANRGKGDGRWELEAGEKAGYISWLVV